MLFQLEFSTKEKKTDARLSYECSKSIDKQQKMDSVEVLIKKNKWKNVFLITYFRLVELYLNTVYHEEVFYLLILYDRLHVNLNNIIFLDSKAKKWL